MNEEAAARLLTVELNEAKTAKLRAGLLLFQKQTTPIKLSQQMNLTNFTFNFFLKSFFLNKKKQHQNKRFHRWKRSW